ncbi:MAG: hypothetical protein CO029_02625 [Candidatus Magasanikbacteria bacterium CG_4_9_14_0_2_um_filter_41_10]|uniref:Uncharacterized protein n=1 Tax=Candidatus Magasanikbacteria bacterium CG_4_10_14_0_2_um_filter_41_31 TaxID=1974639 RepID=A0A2M7V1W6_9BACT|nr:MAG: hypothetical protein AUJ37_02940 [Candidatus Magasanikbacteria bacterium CG1_02_41_34]PIZ92327.1 MAG: hypothetical protein COX83_04515 [Candidatus Magasanikbacteria bacterium CG_4_10_14_0_2_um_filter_41_31]PJC53461.1 MAG: hypothetical protein CO029_02625 [Candidatus Magasanikbacteria bacterium CG_4_9_14_0_2_um_filter_41_10]
MRQKPGSPWAVSGIWRTPSVYVIEACQGSIDCGLEVHLTIDLGYDCIPCRFFNLLRNVGGNTHEFQGEGSYTGIQRVPIRVWIRGADHRAFLGIDMEWHVSIGELLKTSSVRSGLYTSLLRRLQPHSKVTTDQDILRAGHDANRR